MLKLSFIPYTDSPISLKQYIKQADIDLIPVARLIGQSIPKDRGNCIYIFSRFVKIHYVL